MTHSGRGASPGATDMKEESDGTLLYYMSCRDTQSDRVLSDHAWTEFHRRHMPSLLRQCRRMNASAGGSEDFTFNLAQATFAKAVERHDTFKDDLETDSPERRTLSWLGAIARNLLRDSLRNPNRPGPLTGGEQDPIGLEDISDDRLAAALCDGTRFPRRSDVIHLVAEALPSLDERARFVLVQTVMQRELSPKGSYMFRGSAEALAQRFATTTANIRLIRKKAIAAIGEFVTRHGGPTS